MAEGEEGVEDSVVVVVVEATVVVVGLFDVVAVETEVDEARRIQG